MINKIKNLYYKNEEIVNYIIIGGFTTVVSLASYYLSLFIGFDYIVSTIISWIAAVVFAYIFNRTTVFKSKNKKVEVEFFKFVASRLFSLGVDLLFMYIMVDWIGIDKEIAKLLVQIVILVLNYISSKVFVFKK